MAKNKLLLILGNQLFPINEISKTDCKTIVMKEDLGLATDYFHHKLKIHMFFVAMREYRDELINMAIKSRNYYTSRITNCNIDLDKHYSKKEMKELLKTNTKLVKVKSHGWDKYGRFLGEIFVDKVNINNEMVEKDYGYSYDGGTKKTFDVKV